MRRRSLALLLAVAILATGCMSTELRYIRPTELPKLTGPTMGTVAGGAAQGAAIAVATRTVETPEGRLIEVRGEFDVVVKHTSGEYTFKPPIRAQITPDGDVTIWSGEAAPWSAPLRDIQRVGVAQEKPNQAGNVILYLAVLAGTLLLTAALIS